MSKFENYSTVSEVYDSTRVPVGIESILGCFAINDIPLDKQNILDTGCGTGNYLNILRKKLGHITGIDLNEGMLSQTKSKVGDAKNVTLKQGSLLELPFEDNQFDGITCNQVVHHLDTEDDGFTNLEKYIKEAFRVLKPNGVFIINIASHLQIEDGYWWATLIPQAIESSKKRHCDLDKLKTILADTGFSVKDTIALLDSVLQAKNYLTPDLILDENLRNTDSSFSMGPVEEVNKAIETVKNMVDKNEFNEFISKREKLRKKVGQTTFIYARKE